jgi:hypothetical protein
MYVLDAFETCQSWPVTFELVSPVESTALGKCSFQVKPLICDAIAAHGSSPIACQSASLRHFEGNEVAVLDFELRVIFFKMCRKRAATENLPVKDLTQAAISRMAGNDWARTMPATLTRKTESQPTISTIPSSFQSSEEKPQMPRPHSARSLRDAGGSPTHHRSVPKSHK